MGRVHKINVILEQQRTTLGLSEECAALLRQFSVERKKGLSDLLAPVLRDVPKGERRTKAETWIRAQSRPRVPFRRTAEALQAERPPRPPHDPWEAYLSRLPAAQAERLRGLASARIGTERDTFTSCLLAQDMIAARWKDDQMAELLGLDLDIFRAAVRLHPEVLACAVSIPQPDQPLRRWASWHMVPYWEGRSPLPVTRSASAAA